MSSTASLFTSEESEAIKSSWKLLTNDGLLPVGLLLFERLFTDVPEVRHLFRRVGINDEENSSNENFTTDSLRSNEDFVKHAERVVETLDFVVKNLDATDVLVASCVELGQAHKMYNVKPEYFDRLGGVLLDVLQAALKMDLNHPTIQAWKKAYGAISGTAKPQL